MDENSNKTFVWCARIIELVLALVLLASIPFFFKAGKAVGGPGSKFWIAICWLCVAMGVIGLRIGVTREEVSPKWQVFLLGILLFAFASFNKILESLVGLSR